MEIKGFDSLRSCVLAGGKIQRVPVINYKEIAVDLKKQWAAIVVELMGSFKKTDKLTNVWINLIRWVCSWPSCEYDLNKAISIVGGTGSTKTVTMAAFWIFIQRNAAYYMKGVNQIHLKFQYVKLNTLVEDYEKNGKPGLSKWLIMPNLAIDDIGQNYENANHFGEKLDVFEYIYNLRCDEKKMTHFTSNLNHEQLQDRYSERFYSRFCGNNNCIILHSDIDFRGELKIFE